MLGNLNGWHLVIILVVILLLFGATRLPALSKSLGQSMRIFRTETRAMKADDQKAEAAAPNGEGGAHPGATTTSPVSPSESLPPVLPEGSTTSDR